MTLGSPVFIEYLRIKEDQPFIDYVNERTSMALADKEKGEGVITLRELQSEYEWSLSVGAGTRRQERPEKVTKIDPNADSVQPKKRCDHRIP